MTEEQPIRIAQIIGKWVGGGVESVVMNYYRNMDKTKVQFDFICDEDSTNIPYNEIESLGGKVILIPPYQKIFKYHKKLKKVLKEGNYKIVHSHINTLSVFSLFAAACAGVPIRIAHSHSTTNPKEKKKNLLKQVLKPFSKLFATDFMCCSELAGRWLFGNKSYDKEEVYILNNAIDIDKFKYDKTIREKKRKELNIEDKTLVIGHIGRFVDQKNHTFLIDVFNEVHKQNNNSILLLVGQGPLEDKIKEKVNNLGLNNYVKFLGQRNDANELYQAFDIFLLPSLYEGLGMVLIEAQVSGLPCIASTEVPKSAKICKNVHFLNLENSKEWANSITKNNIDNNRTSYIDEASRLGYNISNEANKLERKYIYMYKKVKIFIADSNNAYPVPAVRGGAVQSLVEKLAIMADEENINLEITSFYDKSAYEESLNYKNINFKWIKVPVIIRFLDYFFYNFVKIVKKSSAISCRKIFSLIHYILKSSKDLKKNYYYKVILENNVPLIYIIRFSKYQGEYYYHFHNTPRINVHCNKYFKECKKILCVSNFIKNEISSGITGIGKINVITLDVLYNRIDTNLFSPCSENERLELKKKLNINDNDFVVIYVGRISKEKGVDVLLDAVDKINNIKLLIVGSTFHNVKSKSSFEKKLYDKTKFMNDKVIFTGYIDQKELYKYYNISNVAVLPSVWNEPAGLTMVEAISCGIPLITTNAGGIPEYVGKYAIIVNNDKNLLNNLIKEIEIIKESKPYISNDIIDYIRDEFSYKKYLDDFLNKIDY